MRSETLYGYAFGLYFTFEIDTAAVIAEARHQLLHALLALDDNHIDEAKSHERRAAELLGHL